jgi:hypothetical protein
MRLALKQLESLASVGKLDAEFLTFLKTLVAQARAQGSNTILDTSRCSEAKFVEEIVADEPQCVTTTEENFASGREADVRAAEERMKHWSQFLVDDTHNIELLRQHILKEFGGRLSAAAIDASVAANKAALHWKAPVAKAQAPPPPPPVRRLENGEPELRIGATESEMRQASVVQLRDLDSRRRGSRQKFQAVSQGSGSQLMEQVHEYPPLPAEVTRKVLVNCARAKFDQYRRLHGDDNINARLQGRA